MIRSIVLALLLVSTAMAQPYPGGNSIALSYQGTSVLAPSIAPSATVTSTPIPWSGSLASLAWDLAGGTYNVSLTILQSNNPAGPFTQWPTTSPGGATNPKTQFNVTTASGGTDLVMARSDFVEIQVSNSDASHTNTLTAIKFLGR